MGREVRRVPADWQHPKDDRGNYIPLYAGPFSKRVAEWDEDSRQWSLGFMRDYSNYPASAFKPKEGPALEYPAYEDWDTSRPVAEDYMPDWPEAERTHLMMYEDTSEGTPISPAFETPEELARWLADNNASAFGGSTATYEQWLGMARGGWAPSMVIDSGRMMSGVEFMATEHGK